MSLRRLALIVACIVLPALVWPATSSADHLKTSATVSALVKERRSTDYWTVEISWTAGCQGAADPWYDGNLYMVDAETGQRHYVGGVVDVSGQRSVSGKREWAVVSIERAQHLRPELTIHCYEHFPLHGAPDVTVSGAPVIIPPRFRGGAGSGAGGGEGGDYGRGDPTQPLGAGGCGAVLQGTEGPEILMGSDGGDVIFGFGGNDRILGRRGHDCLIGGSGNDVLRGERGRDRLTAGRGNDVLVGGRDTNAYDAGPGRDFVDARNGRRELVRCGRGRDRARIDRRDRVRSCERVSRPR